MLGPPAEITLLSEQGTHICPSVYIQSVWANPFAFPHLNILVSVCVCVCLNRVKALECVQSLPTGPICWLCSLTSPTGALYTSASPRCSTSLKNTGEHTLFPSCTHMLHTSHESSHLMGLFPPVWTRLQLWTSCGPAVTSRASGKAEIRKLHR